ncbi:Polynucleotide 5'-hydroxyl-kinase grc3 [Coemansia spiralis]|uniref:Polynucleotide 5'-hydroxyl-kinase GRC3 n=2 Tax=Coemansia TaxID=4863 RepID=A0A9W8G2P6_9FUNG|nr:Polynucleotide 5'-hydroxyl-kinase grc3 [Coemansia umbellata]KAJ2619336.1 Polynucleotide 5'-hydroxyl-kinase grc3 [Coemansia sp. RSA 1358]KAJ2670718.1 Polynucleotide 5'-hydroxyl-kinase grc3 [Coemansia spiralis]
MDASEPRKNSRLFTPRPRSTGSEASSAHASRFTSRIRTPQSPSTRANTPSTPLPETQARTTVELNRYVTATTWSQAAAGRSVLIGVSNSDFDSSKHTLAAIANTEPLACRYGVAVEIPTGQAIVFQGIVDLCVISGAVSVYGYTATTTSGWMRIYSPSSHPLVQIEAVLNKNKGQHESNVISNDKDEDVIQIQQIWNGALADDNKSEENASSSIIAFRAVKCGLDDIGTAAPPYRSLFAPKSPDEDANAGITKRSIKRKIAFTRTESSSKIKKMDGQEYGAIMAENNSYRLDGDGDDDNDKISGSALVKTIGLLGFYPVQHLANDQQLLMAPKDWIETLDTASSTHLQLDEKFEPICPTYVVAGGQSQGKSTFSRFLLNRLLNRYGRLFYMETDIGQSELSPPGALSVTLLTNPLFGPPFTHVSQIEPYHAVYMGTTSPKNDPDRYVAAVQRLNSVVRDAIVALRKEQKRDTPTPISSEHEYEDAYLDKQVIPIVVNTHGWLKGLGLDLHYSLCEVVQPTTYIQLYDPVTGLSGQLGADGQAYEGEENGRYTPIVDFSSIPSCNPQLVWISAMNPDRALQLLQSRSFTVFGGQKEDDQLTDEPSEAIESNSFAAAMTTALQSETPLRKAPKLAAYDMRNLALISHFYADGGDICLQSSSISQRMLQNSEWNMQIPLAARCPLQVPWSDLVLWLGEEDIPPSQLPRALSGTVVGVIATASAQSSSGHTWTDDVIRGLYTGEKGISDQAAAELSEPGSRMLLRTAMEEHKLNQAGDRLPLWNMPQIVYGHPNMENTTFLCHALVRSVDPAEGNIHLILPPLVTAHFNSKSAGDGSSNVLEQGSSNLLYRIIGLCEGPGAGALGIELPVWSMVDGGYSERAMGASLARTPNRFGKRRITTAVAAQNLDSSGEAYDGVNLGIQEAPYLSIENDEGIGASTTKSRGGLMRRALQ